MPENENEFVKAWLEYIKAVRQLLVLQKNDRPLDQYLMFRDKVYELIQEQNFLNALATAWLEPDLPNELREALLMELKAFPLAIEVAQSLDKNKEKRSWWRKWLGRSSTVAGSVKDLLNRLPIWAQNTITIFKELIDLLKGK